MKSELYLEDSDQVPATKPASSWEALASVAKYRPRELARLVGVSLRTLQRHFSKSYEMTVSEWLRNVRLTEAYQRLVAGDTIKEVTIDLQFKQLSHFSREFKRMYGVPPSVLQRTLDPGARHANENEPVRPREDRAVGETTAPQIVFQLP
jgi:AraC-like DNA-binding protein